MSFLTIEHNQVNSLNEIAVRSILTKISSGFQIKKDPIKKGAPINTSFVPFLCFWKSFWKPFRKALCHHCDLSRPYFDSAKAAGIIRLLSDSGFSGNNGLSIQSVCEHSSRPGMSWHVIKFTLFLFSYFLKIQGAKFYLGALLAAKSTPK